jgi:hypothetical protein
VPGEVAGSVCGGWEAGSADGEDGVELVGNVEWVGDVEGEGVGQDVGSELLVEVGGEADDGVDVVVVVESEGDGGGQLRVDVVGEVEDVGAGLFGGGGES